MKKITVLFFLLFFGGISTFALATETISIEMKSQNTGFKAGLALGYPSGLTAGYHFTPDFELNATVGTNFKGIEFGLNGLFTVVNLEIGGEIFPLSFGPEINFIFWKFFQTDVLAVSRLEYTFKEIPLNLFLEAGLGIGFTPKPIFAGCGSLGVRYVF